MQDKLSQLAGLYEQLKELNEKVTALKGRIAAMERAVLSEFAGLPPGATVPVLNPRQDRRYTFAVREVTHWRPRDWDALYAHVRETGDFTLFPRRVISSRLGELHATGAAPWATSITLPQIVYRSTPYMGD